MANGRTLNHYSEMSHAFTEEGIWVWCEWAECEARTNYDGNAHFCQYCGSTDHKRIS